MANISIFGKGKMGNAIGGNFEAAGNKVTYITRDAAVDQLGEIVVLGQFHMQQLRASWMLIGTCFPGKSSSISPIL